MKLMNKKVVSINFINFIDLSCFISISVKNKMDKRFAKCS